MKTTIKHSLASVLLLSFAASGLVHAKEEQATAEEEIRYRQSLMTVLGRARSDLQAMAKGEVPFDAAAAQKNAVFINTLASLSMRGYGPGTEKGAPTKADLKIWKELPKYKAANDKMVAEIAKLPAATKDKGSLKDALGEIGKTCKSCHDTYKLVEYRN